MLFFSCSNLFERCWPGWNEFCRSKLIPTPSCNNFWKLILATQPLRFVCCSCAALQWYFLSAGTVELLLVLCVQPTGRRFLCTPSTNRLRERTGLEKTTPLRHSSRRRRFPRSVTAVLTSWLAVSKRFRLFLVVGAPKHWAAVAMDSADDKEKSGAASAANKARPGKKELRNADTILKQLVGNLPAEERLQVCPPSV